MPRLRLLLALSPALLAAGCGGGAKPVKAGADGAAVDAVKARAQDSHESLDRGGAPAPRRDAVVKGETVAVKAGLEKASAEVERGQADERSGKVLGKDPEGCTWIEGVASVAVGEQDTRHQARAMAIEQARAGAIQDFAGVDVKSKFMDFQQEGLRGESRLTESLLQTTRNGRILKEEVLEEGYRDAPGCPSCRYRARLKACVLAKAEAGDKDFMVELQLNRVRFVHGDEAKVTLTATRDCWVYLYDVYDLGSTPKTALIAPNELLREVKLAAGVPWEYPDAAAKKLGIAALHAELVDPDKDAVSAETIRVVASKTPLKSEVYDPTDGGWLGVLRRLNRARAEWAEDAEAFTIYKR
ncbi:MAG: hypothetical protein SF051_15660 [Elusimicrobiota bacterium]|nr:hypothetical protein [Elusimicrobiota bacterium]